MERRRSQQQKIKQQQRFCISQQDLTEVIAKITSQRRATHAYILDISPNSSLSTSSVETLTVPSVSQLIKDFEARVVSTPYESTEEFSSNRESDSHGTDAHDPQPRSERTKSIKINEPHKAEAPPAEISRKNSLRFTEIRTKEAELNHALADLISISNDGDISSSISSSSRSLAVQSQRQRDASVNDNAQSISTSIALLNELLASFELTTQKENETIKPINKLCLMMSDNVCANCQQSFAANEQIVNAAGHVWHTHCFVCAQCFQPFENGIYFEHEGRKYCERDFQMLFAPCCAECKQPIVGRVIRALQKCFHPDCFRCQICQALLVEIGFSKNNGRALCRDCHSKEKAKDPNASQQTCSTCKQMIESKYIKYKGECFHPYHFQCTTCGNDLDENTREVQGSLYCLPCYNKLDLPVCAACRRMIDDRVISALGKQWHVEHFCCARCGQAFRGSKHFENKGLAYCENDYHFLFGSTCFICNRIITEGAYTACNKKYCPEHFSCSICETKMNEKSKFFDVDATPVCKHCYGKIPADVRKSLQQHQKKKQLSTILRQSAV